MPSTILQREQVADWQRLCADLRLAENGAGRCGVRWQARW